jgi:hypothetical protein
MNRMRILAATALAAALAVSTAYAQPANAHIVRNAAGDKNDLKPGAEFRVQEAMKQPDGTYTASRINVGRDGARPF